MTVEQLAARHGFTDDGDGTFSIRENGNVCDETAGAEDIKAGHAFIRDLKEIGVEASGEVVDEWVIIQIRN